MKTLEEFSKLPKLSKAYQVARLYIGECHVDTKGNYKTHLFKLRTFFNKQDHSVLGVLYEYLYDHVNNGQTLDLWQLFSTARNYCRKKRVNKDKQVMNEVEVKKYKDYLTALKEWK